MRKIHNKTYDPMIIFIVMKTLTKIAIIGFLKKMIHYHFFRIIDFTATRISFVPWFGNLKENRQFEVNKIRSTFFNVLYQVAN